MIVSKVKSEDSNMSELFVDSWQLKHTEEGDFEEKFIGKGEMEEKDSLLYLGYMLSPRGSNLSNIRPKNQKSIGTQDQIPKLIEPLGP